MLLDLLDAVEHLDQPRMVIEERALHRSGGELLELGQFLIGLRRSHALDDVEPRQRADAIAAFGIAKRLVVDELGVAVILHRFADHLGEALRGDAVFNDVALRIRSAAVRRR